MARELDRLSSKAVAAKRAPGYYNDGGGLYLQVSPTLSRSWIFRYRIGRVRREMGLGSSLDVPLAEARLKRDTYRKLLREGVDPIQARKNAELERRLASSRSMTFRQCAAGYIESHSADWKNKKHKAQWENTLETYCGETFGALPAQEIDTAIVLKALQPIWTKKPETATRVRSRVERVLDWAKVRGYRQGENPAMWRGHLDQLLPKLDRKKRVKHHAALSFDDVSAFMSELRQEAGAAARALQHTILTVSRTNETLGARRKEFDLNAQEWTIPAQRMKSHRVHRVPLSEHAVRNLRALGIETMAPDDFVFTGADGNRPLSNMAMLALLKRMGRKGLTVHGFRSSFRDWAAERTHYSREVCEAALAHVVADATEAAYRRGDLMEKRCLLMAEWDRFCWTKRNARAEVITLHRPSARRARG